MGTNFSSRLLYHIAPHGKMASRSPLNGQDIRITKTPKSFSQRILPSVAQKPSTLIANNILSSVHIPRTFKSSRPGIHHSPHRHDHLKRKLLSQLVILNRSIHFTCGTPLSSSRMQRLIAQEMHKAFHFWCIAARPINTFWCFSRYLTTLSVNSPTYSYSNLFK